MTIRRRIADETGASLVEYALLVALVALVCFTAVTFLGDSASSRYDSTGSQVESAGN